MALESFYGGKPGYSPIIKSTFKSIEEMNTYFQDPTYKDVWYGELCIITPDSMYDADNGKIFRRTLKKQSSSDETYGSLYAEYLGQIVGMPGGLPKVVFNTIDNIKALPSEEENEEKDIWYPTGLDNGYVETSNDKENLNNFATLNGTEGIEFVPGMQKDGNNIIYNDNFKYTWLQIADPQSNAAESDGTRGTLHLGLKIPYMYLDTPVITPVSYLESSDVTESDIALDNNHHPFYRKYTFSIPDGVRGIGIRNLRIETKASLNIIESNTKVLDPTKNIFDYNENDRNITIITNGNYYDFDPNKYQNDSLFWVYDLIVPSRNDSSLNPTTSYICYAGDYEGITDVTLNNDGTFTFNTGYNEITTDNKKEDSRVKWITSATIVTDPDDEDNYGQFTIKYNTEKLENEADENETNENEADENEADKYEKQVYNLPLIKRIVAYSTVSNNNENSNNIANAGENINVELVDSTGGTRTLSLLKSTGQDSNGQESYDTYKLKYPCSLAITTHNNSNFDNQENGDSDNQENENSDSQETTKDPFYYLTVTYNDGITTEELGPVGVQNVDKLGSDIAIGEEKTTFDQNTSSYNTTIEKIPYYFPEVVKENPIMLINEDIDFGTLDFPSFTT